MYREMLERLDSLGRFGMKLTSDRIYGKSFAGSGPASFSVHNAVKNPEIFCHQYHGPLRACFLPYPVPF